jgi:oxygen-dependent protoporphyrinogen oxidase
MHYEVIILGGGIAGLSTARRLEKQGINSLAILEKNSQLGGKISTLYPNDYVIDEGADSFVVLKPELNQLIDELGIRDELISPKASGFKIRTEDGLITPPQGLNGLVPTNLELLKNSNFFTEQEVEEISQEKDIKLNIGHKDVSLKYFVEHRFGEGMYKKFAAPLFAGIYNTPGENLSMKSCFPHWLQMVEKHGSMTTATLSAPQPPQSGNRSPYVTFKKGMYRWIEILQNQLLDTYIHTSTEITVIHYNPDTQLYTLTTPKQTFTCRELISTLQINQLLKLLQPHTQKHTYLEPLFPYSSSVIYTFVFDTHQLNQPLEGTGFVSIENLNKPMRSATYTSNKWDYRCPEDETMVRVFSYPDVPVADVWTDFATLHNISGNYKQHWQHAWYNSQPQYVVGLPHSLETLHKFLSDNYPNLTLNSVHTHKPGVPDCLC